LWKGQYAVVSWIENILEHNARKFYNLAKKNAEVSLYSVFQK